MAPSSSRHAITMPRYHSQSFMPRRDRVPVPDYRRSQHPICSLALAIIAAGAGGCGRPGRLAPVASAAVDPPTAAAAALKLYDRDGDGRLNANEIAACPGLLAAKARYDSNQDGAIAADELAARFATLFTSSSTSLTSVHCSVFRGSQPLANATLRFVPEAFFDNALKSAVGTTDVSGVAMVAIPDDQMPENERGLQSMQPGLYRVQIEHPGLKQPAPPLGCEIDPTTRGGTDITLRL